MVKVLLLMLNVTILPAVKSPDTTPVTGTSVPFSADWTISSPAILVILILTLGLSGPLFLCWLAATAPTAPRPPKSQGSVLPSDAAGAATLPTVPAVTHHGLIMVLPPKA